MTQELFEEGVQPIGEGRSVLPFDCLGGIGSEAISEAAVPALL